MPADVSPWVKWVLMLIVAAGFAGFAWLRLNPRTRTNIEHFCAAKYRQARTAADSAAIDKYEVVPSAKHQPAVVCRDYRVVK